MVFFCDICYMLENKILIYYVTLRTMLDFHDFTDTFEKQKLDLGPTFMISLEIMGFKLHI